MNEDLKNNLTSSKHWMRFLYMALFVFILYFASFVMFAVVIVQAIFTLITGNDSLRIKTLGDSLSRYIFDALQFLIYNSEEKPFPFSDWPEAKVRETDVEIAEPVIVTPAEVDASTEAKDINPDDSSSPDSDTKS